MTKGAFWVRLQLVAGYAFLCLGWLLTFSWLGVVAFGAGAVLVLGAAVGGAIATRSIRRFLVPLAIMVLVFFAFPVVAGAAFWAGRGFQDSESGSTKIVPQNTRP